MDLCILMTKINHVNVFLNIKMIFFNTTLSFICPINQFYFKIFGIIYCIEFHNKYRKSIYHHYAPHNNNIIIDGGNSVLILEKVSLLCW
jgi:hypothetical protein